MRDARATNPEFPAVCVATNGFVSSVSDRQALESCAATALRTGNYDLLEFIDTAGQVFRVSGTDGMLRSGRKLLAQLWRRLRGAEIEPDLELETGEQLPLSSLQDRICGAMAKLPAQWETAEALSVAQDRVRRARSIREVIDLVGQD
jgi:hypothetical protein